MTMKTLIILNGECPDVKFLQEFASMFDKIVCADGGYLHAVSVNLNVNAVVGDFDSSNLPEDVYSVVYPKDKDLSEAEIAIEFAIKNFGNDITLTCSLGKRLDHQLFNVFLLIKYPFLRIVENDALIFLCGEYNSFREYKNHIVSFIPIEKSNLTLENFKYNLLNQS